MFVWWLDRDFDGFCAQERLVSLAQNAPHSPAHSSAFSVARGSFADCHGLRLHRSRHWLHPTFNATIYVRRYGGITGFG